MISAGTNIASSSDELKKVNLKYVYDSLKNPHADIMSKVRQLRLVRELDPKQYSVLKKQLPYLVCGIFNPPFRRTENFAYTEYFGFRDLAHDMFNFAKFYMGEKP